MIWCRPRRVTLACQMMSQNRYRSEESTSGIKQKERKKGRKKRYILRTTFLYKIWNFECQTFYILSTRHVCWYHDSAISCNASYRILAICPLFKLIVVLIIIPETFYCCKNNVVLPSPVLPRSTHLYTLYSLTLYINKSFTLHPCVKWWLINYISFDQ